MENTDVLMTLNGQTFTVSSEESPFTMLLQHDFNLNYLDYQVKKVIFEMKSERTTMRQKLRSKPGFTATKKTEHSIFPLGMRIRES